MCLEASFDMKNKLTGLREKLMMWFTKWPEIFSDKKLAAWYTMCTLTTTRLTFGLCLVCGWVLPEL